MHTVLRSLPVLVLAVVLISGCTAEKINPTATAQATLQSTSLPAPLIDGTPTAASSPTVILVEDPTGVPTITPIDEPTSDVVHLGVPWADFSLRFDALQWEISSFDDDLTDLQSLSHRTLAGCRITPNIPVGLGEDWTIEVEQITLGQLGLEARYFYQSGALIFAGYYNFLNPYGDGAVEVHFIDHSETCLQAAEALFAATEVILP